jgi:hypothetical protein
MKLNLFAVLLAAALLLVAPGSLSAPAQSTDTPSGPVDLSDQDLQQLVAPIALYPDPMLALILQASTVPSDIVLASRWLNNDGDPDDIDAQPWDDSVKGLARYPDVLQMMDDNLDWTNQLGAAVLAQQADVMRAVQAMRAKAQTLGNLATTPQQQVIVQNNIIEIVPANPQVIYVPVYNPAVIYYQPAPPIIFGPGFSIGIWIGGGCNWNNYNFYRSGFYRPGYGWGYRPGYGNVWRPPPGRPPPRPPYRPGKPGHLPGWRPPPNGGKPPGGNKPRPPTNGPGKPSIQPVPNPGNGNPGKPGKPSGGKPSTQPVPKPGNGNTGKPNTRPNPKPRPEKPVTTQPVKPQPKPAPSRPSPQPKPSPKPPPSNNFDHNRPSSKPHAQPTPAQQKPSRPAQGGSGGGQGNRQEGR